MVLISLWISLFLVCRIHFNAEFTVWISFYWFHCWIHFFILSYWFQCWIHHIDFILLISFYWFHCRFHFVFYFVVFPSFCWIHLIDFILLNSRYQNLFCSHMLQRGPPAAENKANTHRMHRTHREKDDAARHGTRTAGSLMFQVKSRKDSNENNEFRPKLNETH